VLDLTHDGHAAMASKDRTKLFEEPELITEETGRRLLGWLNSGVSPEERAKELLVDALADIAASKDIASLQSAFSAAKAVAFGFDDLIQQVVVAKDKRKNVLSSQRQSA